MLRDVERSSVGEAAGRACGLGGRPRRRVRAECARAPVLGRLRRVVRRARTLAAESTAKLLLAAGSTSRSSAPRESCTGDPARRMGNEYVFQAFAEQNVSTLNEAGVTKIVASCPHCFNTLANEYPDFGGRYEVVHHTELLAELVRDGRLAPAAGGARITYHDSCYLARHNDVLAAPRELVAAVGRPRRDAAEREAHVLLRRRRRPHVDGGARDADQRGARARGGGDRAQARSPSPARSARSCSTTACARSGASCASPTSLRCSSRRRPPLKPVKRRTWTRYDVVIVGGGSAAASSRTG